MAAKGTIYESIKENHHGGPSRSFLYLIVSCRAASAASAALAAAFLAAAALVVAAAANVAVRARTLGRVEKREELRRRKGRRGRDRRCKVW